MAADKSKPPKGSNGGKDRTNAAKPSTNAADGGAAAPEHDPVELAQAMANVRPDPIEIEPKPAVLGTMDISALDDPGSERGTDAQAVAAEDALPATGDSVALTNTAMVPQQYQATLVENAQAIETEVGATGLKGAEPYSGWVYEESIPQLRGLSGARFYKQMADSDPMCGAIVFALKMLMKKVTWRVDPKNSTPEAQLAQERVQAMLFEDMAHPFGQLIDEASSMLTYGYAPHEIIWKRCQGANRDPLKSSQFKDGVWAPAALPVRSQDTVWRWIFDAKGKGNILGFEQLLVGVPNAPVPMAKALLFRTETNRNNPEGRSVLRNAYVPYLRKNVIEESEGRLAVRSAGIVDLRIPAKFMDPGAGDAEKLLFTYYKNVAEKAAQDRQGSVVLPSDRDEHGNLLYDMKFLAADNRQLKDFSPIVERYDARIAVTVLADFLLLGMKAVGSWALADSKTSMFVLAVEGFLGVIAEQLNKVLLRKVWRLNGWDMQLIPTLKPGTVQKADLAVLGPFLQQLSAAGAPLFPSKDNALEQWLLEQAGAPNLAEVG
jgi:hypothetical protein